MQLFDPNSSYLFGQWMFLKLLAATYFIAFLSLYLQILGLYGKNGIIPFVEIFKGIRKEKKGLHYYFTPSIFWISCSDKMLKTIAFLGMLFSIFALFNFLPSFSLFICWFFYLSFLAVSIYFLSFQWDTLLLEVGFLGWLLSLQTPPVPIIVFAFWVLLFRFYFSSGFVKFFTGSKEWKELTALSYHYETQPLPTKAAYYLYQMPMSFSKVSTALVFTVEMVIPFFIFINAEFRLAAFFIFLIFQIILMISGNFAFFNWLTIALSFLLLEDTFVPFITPIQASTSVSTTLFVSLTSMFLIVCNFIQFTKIFDYQSPFHKILKLISPFYMVNHYGLFSHMTKERKEIVIEGSNDGKEWKEYVFKWKPQDLQVPPKTVAPYQPRLDWQMWFAALSSFRNHPWFIYLLKRLLEGSKDVVNLLKTNPFEEKPPKYVRAKLYRYHFTNLKEKEELRCWWKKEELGLYYPPITKDSIPY